MRPEEALVAGWGWVGKCVWKERSKEVVPVIEARKGTRLVKGPGGKSRWDLRAEAASPDILTLPLNMWK